ncbi:MAG: ATP-binding protein [Gammaproteobacteria bacterium]|nr:ATP-binding protein [Gammaproteobacteria bacterium]
MLPKKILNSGFTFSESESNLEFKFRVLNSILFITALFTLLIGLLGDYGINDIGQIQPKVNYLHSVICVILIFLLRIKRELFTLTATILVISSLASFISVLIFVIHDEFRLIWFYLVIYVTYVLLGPRAGSWMTIAVVASIITSANLFDLNLSKTAFFTAAVGLFIASLFNRSYSIEMSTNVNRLDKALVKAKQASDAKSLFLANISHEIRTPLNGMLGMAQVIQGTKLDDEQKHYLETFEQSGKTLQFLIDELLDLAKIESGTLALDPKAFDSFRWVMDIQMVTEPLFEENDVSFTTEIGSELPELLFGDSPRLMQVVINLVSNAAKFTHHGEVRLKIGGKPIDENRFNLQISVRDSGIGIPKDRLREIFNSFQQLSSNTIANKGVGLGLAISERLVSAMGGKLDVSSTEGEGSQFWFSIELPIIREAAPSSVATKQHDNDQQLSILLVDDDAINRLAASMLLKQAGHLVEMAADGMDAIEKLKTGSYDAVLMDIHMPMMDGVEATKLIRADTTQKNCHIPIIGVTASVMSDERKLYLEIGMDAVVEKPIISENLLQTIWNTLDQQQAQKRDHQPAD